MTDSGAVLAPHTSPQTAPACPSAPPAWDGRDRRQPTQTPSPSPSPDNSTEVLVVDVRQPIAAVDVASTVQIEMPTMARRCLKRGLDLALGIPAAILAAPVIGAVALTVKLTSRGPAFYSHTRIKRNGDEFSCLKFRSMRADADERLRELLETNVEFAAEWRQKQKVGNDPRVTPIGKFLRRSSLDELPQLFNVIRGEMSIVGPRPIVADEMVRYGPDLPTVLRVKPGLTGSWQVSGRSSTTYAERVELDVDYARSPTLRRDLAICVKTLSVVLGARGAH